MREGIKITDDGFVWKTLTLDQSLKIHESKALELFLLYEDGTEVLVDDIATIDIAHYNDYEIGIEVGRIDKEERKRPVLPDHNRYLDVVEKLKERYSQEDGTILLLVAGKPSSFARYEHLAWDKYIIGRA